MQFEEEDKTVFFIKVSEKRIIASTEIKEILLSDGNSKKGWLRLSDGVRWPVEDITPLLNEIKTRNAFIDLSGDKI